MYQLNASTSFTERTKSVFDTLLSIESTHQSKAGEYIVQSEQQMKANDQPEPVDQMTSSFEQLNETKSNRGDDIFKVPKPVKRCHNRRRPDHELNPHKWKRYSLRDVPEMGHGGNYAAAMSFLNANKKQAEETSEPVVFNRPLGGNKKKLVVHDDSDLLDRYEIEDQTKLQSDIKKRTFPKKNAKKNLRRVEEEPEEQEHVATVAKLNLRGSRSFKISSKRMDTSIGQDDLEEVEEENANDEASRI